MTSFKPKFKKSHNQNGFVAIIALGIFALMMIFAITLQMTTMDTLQSIKNSRNYNKARIVADSMMEYLQWKMKSYEVGWNTGTVICGFGKYTNETTMTEGGGQSEFCQDPGLLYMVTPNPGAAQVEAQKDIKVTMSIKGRAEDTEKIKTAKCGTSNNNCYVVPSPGTGDAGDETYCGMYKPAFMPAVSGDKVPFDLANSTNTLDQLNYSCNWNKLTFGSGLTDRVAVPLYYDSAAVGGASTIVNPFHKDTDAALKAGNILVRLRTPCVPCGKTMANGQPRVCDALVKDETVCSNGQRYVLDDGGTTIEDSKNDIVVQWLINGECATGPNGKLESCGMIPIGDKEQDIDVISAFYESRINDVTTKDNKNYIIISKETKTYDTNNYPDGAALLFSDNEEKYPKKLDKIFKPVLTLFLSKPLLTTDKTNIPYLEYQVLTDKPIAGSKSIIEVTVTVDGNTFKKTLTKEVPKELIDFAIQN